MINHHCHCRQYHQNHPNNNNNNNNNMSSSNNTKSATASPVTANNNKYKQQTVSPRPSQPHSLIFYITRLQNISLFYHHSNSCTHYHMLQMTTSMSYYTHHNHSINHFHKHISSCANNHTYKLVSNHCTHHSRV